MATTSLRTIRPPARQPYDLLRAPDITYTTRLITPAEARETIPATTFVGQRASSPAHVAFLSHLMAHQHFREGTEVSFAVLPQERMVVRSLINGLHTFTALSQQSRPLWLTVVEHTVRDIAEVWQLYRTYDLNLRRTWPALYKVDTRFPAHDLLPRDVTLLGTVTAPLAFGFQDARPDPQSPRSLFLKDPYLRGTLICDWAEEMRTLRRQCWGIGRLENRRLLTRATVLAIALITYRWLPVRAAQFWPALVQDSGLRAGDPAQALLYYLRNHPARTVPPAQYARAIANCWSNFVNGRALREPHPRDSSLPLELAKTPHDGKASRGYLTAEGQSVRTPVVLAG